jgi:LPS O-antigen subunit length determinant protein (WzzB/FepE family)
MKRSKGWNKTASNDKKFWEKLIAYFLFIKYFSLLPSFLRKWGKEAKKRERLVWKHSGRNPRFPTAVPMAPDLSLFAWFQYYKYIVLIRSLNLQFKQTPTSEVWAQLQPRSQSFVFPKDKWEICAVSGLFRARDLPHERPQKFPSAL